MSLAYDMFVAQLDEAVAMFPTLRRAEAEGGEILKGILPVVDRDGKHWEDYEIEIHSPENFPFQFPMLFETSGKIPRVGDWHVYEDTFACCVKVPPEEIIRCRNGIRLTEYIREEVMPYLFNQTHRRVEGYYVNGEYAHGAAGIYEYYSNVLKTGSGIAQTVQLMYFIASNQQPSRTSLCFCGQKMKFRHCHRDAFYVLKLIGNETLLSHALAIKQAAHL